MKNIFFRESRNFGILRFDHYMCAQFSAERAISSPENGDRISGIHPIGTGMGEKEQQDSRRARSEAKIAMAETRAWLIDSERHHRIHSEQNWEHVLELRKYELELGEIIQELWDEGSDESSAMLSHAAMAQKAVRDALKRIHADVLETDEGEDGTDANEQVALKEDAVDGEGVREEAPSVSAKTELAHAEAQSAQEALSKAIQFAEEKASATPSEENADRISKLDFGADDAETEPRLMDIPADFEATQRKMDELMTYIRRITAMIEQDSVTKDALSAIQKDLALTFREPLEERLNLLRVSHRLSKNPEREAELIAKSLHEIEDVMHRITIARALTAPERIEPIENQIKRKTELRDKLVKISDTLVNALNKTGMENPELEMTLYTQPGIVSGIRRIFGGRATNINAKVLQKAIHDAQRAQAQFNAEYYADDERAQLLREHGSAHGNMPIDRLDDHADVFTVWRTIHREIEALHRDVEAAEDPRAQKESPDPQKEEVSRSPIQQEALDRAQRLGISGAEEIIREIAGDPRADRLRLDGYTYLNQMIRVLEALNSDNRKKAADETNALERMHEELLENGIVITAGSDLIDRARDRQSQPRPKRQRKAA